MNIKAEYIVVVPSGIGINTVICFKPDEATLSALQAVRQGGYNQSSRMSLTDVTGTVDSKTIHRILRFEMGEGHNTAILTVLTF